MAVLARGVRIFGWQCYLRGGGYVDIWVALLPSGAFAWQVYLRGEDMRIFGWQVYLRGDLRGSFTSRREDRRIFGLQFYLPGEMSSGGEDIWVADLPPGQGGYEDIWVTASPPGG